MYTVYDNEGKAICLLNERLANRQKITLEQLEALKESHVLAHTIKEQARNSIGKPLKLRMLAAVFEALEFEQQKLWNFEPNADFHRFFDFPGCTCPKLDNIDRLGSPYKVYNKACLIHGDVQLEVKAIEAGILIEGEARKIDDSTV